MLHNPVADMNTIFIFILHFERIYLSNFSSFKFLFAKHSKFAAVATRSAPLTIGAYDETTKIKHFYYANIFYLFFKSVSEQCASSSCSLCFLFRRLIF